MGSGVSLRPDLRPPNRRAFRLVISAMLMVAIQIMRPWTAREIDEGF